MTIYQVSTNQSNSLEIAQIERALGESQARFASIINTAGEAIICVDETQKIVLFNRGAEETFGYSAAEVINHSLDILLPSRFLKHHRRHVVKFAQSSDEARLLGERQEIVGLRKNGQEFPAEASISKFEVNGRWNFVVILRDITDRKQAEKEREELINRLEVLDEATQAITSELSTEQVLQKIVRAAQSLIKVEFAALGVHNGKGNLSRFITAGVEDEIHAQIGMTPAGEGLLGLILHGGHSIIINDLANHPLTTGFPDHHPGMRRLLGAPIYSKKQLIGAFYLTDKKDGTEFTEIDQRLTEMLARHATIAIENARLYEKVQRLAVLEERERFARDLHDGIIQSIYGVGLSLDNAKALLDFDNETVKTQLDLSLKNLAKVITDVRNYIFDLRPQALKNKGLPARLQGLVKEMQVNTLLVIESVIDPEIGASLDPSQASHFFHIAHEALANVARHAQARRVHLTLEQTEEAIRLRIEDDGIGFEPAGTIEPGHHGLANIYARASQLGADLDIDSAPQQGTRLTLTLAK